MTIYSIYKITNKVNQKIYIGWTKHKNPIKRFKKHIYESNYNPVYILHKAIKKYGQNNFSFEVLEKFTNIKIVKEKEKEYISKFNSYYLTGHGYNMTLGGEGHIGKTFATVSTAWKKGNIPWNKGIKWKEMSGKNHHAYGKKGYNLGKKHPHMEKQYEITFSDGHKETIKGFRKFAKERNYNIGCMNQVISGKLPKHKDIVKIKKL